MSQEVVKMINKEIASRLSVLENNIGYKFNNIELLFEAMTHSSYAHELKINKIACNERMEFLGDAVLQIISSDFLFKKYPDILEGKLSKMRSSLVRESALYQCSKAIDLGEFIMLGRGEENCGGRTKPSVIADAFEALLGAVYMDGGLEKASDIIHRFILTEEQVSEANQADSKSYLQELVQKDGKHHEIEYKIISENGPDHDKEFVVELTIDGEVKSTGKGKSKKAAEKDAATKVVNGVTQCI